MNKSELLAYIQKRKQVSIRSIYLQAGVNPADEQDRQKVWKIGQGLAELHIKKWIDLEQTSDGRYAYIR